MKGAWSGKRHFAQQADGCFKWRLSTLCQSFVSQGKQKSGKPGQSVVR